MANAIEVLFRASGLDAIRQAMSGIQGGLEKLARGAQTTSERSVRARVKGEQDAARAADKSGKDASKSVADTVRAVDRSEREKSQAVKRELREQERERKSAADAEWRFANAGVRAVQEAEREKTRAAEAGARRRSQIARTMGNAFGSATSRVVGGAARLAGTALAIGGGFTVADAVRSGVEEEKTAGVIFRGAVNTGSFTDQKQVQQLARSTAIATGGTSSEILAGLDKFVRVTGDLGVAKDLLEQMAKLSAATGTNFEDMGQTTANVFAQLKDATQTMEVMRALAGQGRAGAIDIKDLGQYGGRLAASAAQFTGSLTGNIESFGAIAQLARKLGGATDAAEATMALQHIGSDVSKKSDAFKSVGVNVFSDSSHMKLRNAEDIITESVVKTKGDLSVLGELFGERSMRAVRGSQVIFANAGGGKAGEAAVRAQFSELKATSLSTDEVDKNVKQRLAENDAKLNQATERFHAALNDRLLPLLPDLIERFTKLIPSIEKFLDFLIKNPWEGLGGIVAAALVAEIAKAGIAGAVSAVVTRVVSGAMSVAAGAGVAGTVAGTAGTTATAAGGAALGGVGEAAGGSLLAGGAMVAGGLLGLGALTYRQYNREKSGQSAAAALIQEGTAGTPEERTARLSRVQSLIGRAEAEEGAADKFRKTGQHSVADDRHIADLEARGAAKELGALRVEAEALKAALAGATGGLQAMTDAAKAPRAQEMNAFHGP